jgi:DnaJ-class molecular chaperone
MSTSIWQKCPICEGSGLVPSLGWTTILINPNKCPTCKGARIISVLTGLPPSWSESQGEIKQDITTINTSKDKG